MPIRPITRILSAQPVTEGAGVQILRSLGLPALRHADPFLLLDHFASDRPEDYLAGFPDHPHRGFVTLTYMLAGHMLHRDSMGNRGDLRAGGAQWMKAASGVIHSEMPQQTDGLMRGFQLWINLPAAEKMSAPAYHEVAPDAIPVLREPAGEVHLLAGELGGVRGPLVDPHTALHYVDVRLRPGARWRHALPRDHTALLYVYEGQALLAPLEVDAHRLALLGPGEALEVVAGAGGTRMVLIGGRPLGEPIVQHGPFVMNTHEDIEQALRDYRDGRLVQTAATGGR
jgi:hypothetical protein